MSNLLVKPSFAIRDREMRIGPISLFALIVIICMATLSVLTIATAHSSLVLSQRQAAATQELYLSETAGQTFIAVFDEILETQATDGKVTDEQLAILCESAQDVTGGAVEVTAHVEGSNVYAEFACEGGRTLKITLAIQPDGSYRIERWKMTNVVNEEQAIGTLYMDD